MSSYFPPNTVSRDLVAQDRSWGLVVYQTGKKALDSEFNLAQEALGEATRVLADLPSGFIDTPESYTFLDPAGLDFVPDAFSLPRSVAVVAGMPVVVEYTDTDVAGSNLIVLDAAQPFSEAPKRSDFVFLEVWKAVVGPSLRASALFHFLANPVPGDILTVGGIAFEAGLDFAIGVDANTTAGNFATALVGEGTYTIQKVQGPLVRIYNDVAGSVGNSTTVTTSTASVSVSGPTMAGGSDGANRPGADIYRHGNVLCDASEYLPDDLVDPTLQFETSQRVQVQYRIRKVPGISYPTHPYGFSAPSVLAQGAESAPVPGYTFAPVPGDGGLWVAGAGDETSATDLGTLDGYVYAIPMAMVFRRNSDLWDAGTNFNGGVAFGVDSDRPDGLFYDQIHETDIVDLRKRPVKDASDASAELLREMQALLDGTNATWATDTSDRWVAGGAIGAPSAGCVSPAPLICQQIGPDSVPNEYGPALRQFDHIARRFGSQPVVERVVFTVSPVLANNPTGVAVVKVDGGATGWRAGDAIEIDFNTLEASSLADWTLPENATTVAGQVPPGTKITDVLRVWHDDGNTGTPIVTNALTGSVSLTDDTATVTVLENVLAANINGGPYPLVGDVSTDGSPRAIFVELEVTYPVGTGLVATPEPLLVPNATTWPLGPLLDVDPLQAAADRETLNAPVLRPEATREVALDQVSNDATATTPLTLSVVSLNNTTIVLPRRISGYTGFDSVTVMVGMTPYAVDSVTYGSSECTITLAGGSPLPDPQTEVDVTFWPQDPISNAGTLGTQVAFYYRARGPQTIGSAASLVPLPVDFEAKPLAASRALYTGQTGPGSVDVSFPYVNPLDQIAAASATEGDHLFTANATVSVLDFQAGTGMLTLHPMVDADTSNTLTVGTSSLLDQEARVYYTAPVAAGLRTTVMAQPLYGGVAHKNWYPMLVQALDDCNHFRAGDLLLLVFTEFHELDATNTLQTATVSVYRTRSNRTMRLNR